MKIRENTCEDDIANTIMDLFFELIQIAVGIRKIFSRNPSAKEWEYLYEFAERQAILGICFSAVKRLEKQKASLSTVLFMKWLAVTAKIQQCNEMMIQRCRELQVLLKSAGFQSCILKGQDYARYYNNLELLRQAGDIDIWVNNRNEVIEFARRNNIENDHINIKNSDIHFYSDVKVEVHFRPSWMYFPIYDKRLYRWISQYSFDEFETKNGMVVPPIDFSLVYAIIHIYRHFFDEGIGLRQIVDYYFILCSSSPENREKAMETLKWLGLRSATAGIMWVMNLCFGSERFEKYQLCLPDEKIGKFLLTEIMIGGNFGQFDKRNYLLFKSNRWKKGVIRLKRNARYLRYFPLEVISAPLWKLWHYCWRKQKGYL